MVPGNDEKTMTPQELAFAEDFFALLKKHRIRIEDTIQAVADSPAPRFVVHMIGFNNLILSKYCIESILEHSPNGMYRLMLTNNGSTDGTREYFDEIARTFPQISVVHEQENTGFQAPNEKAFQCAKKIGATYYVAINNDAEVTQGWLDKLAAPLDASDKAVVSGPLTGCSRVNSNLQGCDDTKLEFVEFSCAMIKMSIASKWPTLFASYLYFIYFEDLEFSLRVQFAGYTIHKAPFRIKHRGSQTAGAHPEAKKRCTEANARNEAVMLKKWAHWNKVRRFDYPIVLKRSFGIGDVLLLTPVIRALHERFALCPIYVETDYPLLFAGNPCVRQAATSIPTQKDELRINMDGSYEATPSRHVIDTYAIHCGLEPSEVGRKLEFYYNGSDAKRGLAGKWCAIDIGPTNWPGRNWPVDRWNEVAQNLRSEGWKVMVLGLPPKNGQILCDMDMRGQQGFAELAGLLAQCQLFAGIDSFCAHMAATVGTPCIVLSGIIDARYFAAYTGKYIAVQSDPAHPDTGRRNREINKTFIQTDDSVMRTISVGQVMGAVKEILK